MDRRLVSSRRALILIATALLASCAGVELQQAHRWPSAADVVGAEAGFSEAGLAALDARMRQAVDNTEVAGIVTLLARGGKIAQFRAHGVQSLASGAPMQEDTLFRIYSMTKPITGVALMQLHEQGLWKLDDPITKFVPELSGLKVLKREGLSDERRATSSEPELRTQRVSGSSLQPPASSLVNPDRPATMRELMTHTAGFGYGLVGGNPVDDAFRKAAPLGAPDLKTMIDIIAKLPLLAQPGERWSYSIAVDIQGAIVERLSGRRFGDYLKQHIFDPLGMRDTKFFLAAEDRSRLAEVYEWEPATSSLKPVPDERGHGYFAADHIESGGGGLVSSTHDYARFCQMLLNRGELDGQRILQPESVALMTQNHIGALRLFSDGARVNSGLPGTGFGLDFAVLTDPAAARTKQGMGAYYWSGIAGTWFWIDPVHDLFFIGMIQRRRGAGPGAVNFRGDSTRLVYEALLPQ